MRFTLLTVLLCSALVTAASAQTIFVGMGDSIGEGVQSADAYSTSQEASYLNWIALKAGIPFPLPLIESGAFETIGNVGARTRIDPTVEGLNLAVSGADLNDILNTRSNAATEAEIDSETDLVLFPRQASQIEIVESLNPLLTVCWIGNNDVLSAAISFDALDASQMTSVAEFDTLFTELTNRLAALDTAVVFANVPDVTSIAFLMDEAELEYFTGEEITLLPAGSFTSLPAMFLIRLGFQDETLLLDPDWVLDAAEVASINQRIADFNEIIATRAAAIGAPVIDANGIFKAIVDNPPVIFGAPLTNTFLGGLFSLDGVHPSNIGHAIIADQVIATVNAVWGASLPRLSNEDFVLTLLFDPHWDKDLDGQAIGRPFAGLLETLAVFTGFTGDPNDFENFPTAPPSTTPSAGRVFSNMPTTREEAVEMMKRIWSPRPDAQLQRDNR